MHIKIQAHSYFKKRDAIYVHHPHERIVDLFSTGKITPHYLTQLYISEPITIIRMKDNWYD